MSNKVKKLLTARFGVVSPDSIEDYIKNGGYASLKKALGMDPEAIITEVKASGLRGRGGAGFPTGIKMESVRRATGSPKYVVCNADEGEPGNFKDRYLMEKDPHQLLEGMIISAFAAGADYGAIFVRGEYINSIKILDNAIKQARKAGFLGKNILGTGFDFEMDVYSGAGSYVCGEEFALLAALEGKPARSTFKPPFPTTEGLNGKPTQINNVETFANIPHIIDMGGAAYAALGTEASTGTKLISLSGNVNHPGLYEVTYDITLREIIEELGGGVPGGRAVKMVQLGGPSGPIIPPSLLDLKIDAKEMRKYNLSIASGAIIVIDDRADALDILVRIMEFFHHESCGKCTPCREGLGQVLGLLDKFVDGTATEADLKLLRNLLDVMSQASLCGLGQAAPTAIKTILQYFGDELCGRIGAAKEVK